MTGVWPCNHVPCLTTQIKWSRTYCFTSVCLIVRLYISLFVCLQTITLHLTTVSTRYGVHVFVHIFHGSNTFRYHQQWPPCDPVPVTSNDPIEHVTFHKLISFYFDFHFFFFVPNKIILGKCCLQFE